MLIHMAGQQSQMHYSEMHLVPSLLSCVLPRVSDRILANILEGVEKQFSYAVALQTEVMMC